ncbi:MAG: carboxypeptidase regulatory-like domain-containing protein [Bacteroidetes bacterium]|jgi:hypothetical protein|nr:carboxypeptidase regulatory-like domain-containing protein [Bacteroidota bacterium]MBT6687646.1 carboxypeptidase regulatory-like domain-containing protein [Bacteroidota bacterium]MBT7144765.1 carboxypeptidase regulatory-like domain-containing protein [Bacteroidota bacterium]MBT7491392.1 carboxypeptidase regulatory-like domain-containing protein [Bacteroidota bacterium]
MKILKIIILSSFILFLFGCGKKEKAILPSGNIVGFVELVDENGNMYKEKEGVNVSIEYPSESTITNEYGRFEFWEILAGTYNLNFNKEGFGTYKKFGYQFIGGNVPALLYTTYLYELPNIEIQSLNVSYYNNTINISGIISETSHYSVQSFINDSSNVSYLNYDFTSARHNHAFGLPTNQISHYICLNGTHYSYGDEVYLVLYFINYYEDWQYYDYDKEAYIYSSYKQASNVIYLVL